MPKQKIPRPEWKKPEKPKTLWQRVLLAFLNALTVLSGGGGVAATKIPQIIRPLYYRVRTKEALAEALPETKTQAAPPVLQEIPSHATYSVVKGDSLWKIAKAFYGRGERWIDVWRSNRNKISEPDLIYPGQQLTIPAVEAHRATGARAGVPAHDVTLSEIPVPKRLTAPEPSKAPNKETPMSSNTAVLQENVAPLLDALKVQVDALSQAVQAIAAKSAEPKVNAMVPETVKHLAQYSNETTQAASSAKAAESRIELIDAAVNALDAARDATSTVAVLPLTPIPPLLPSRTQETPSRISAEETTNFPAEASNGQWVIAETKPPAAGEALPSAPESNLLTASPSSANKTIPASAINVPADQVVILARAALETNIAASDVSQEVGQTIVAQAAATIPTNTIASENAELAELSAGPLPSKPNLSLPIWEWPPGLRDEDPVYVWQANVQEGPLAYWGFGPLPKVTGEDWYTGPPQYVTNAERPDVRAGIFNAFATATHTDGRGVPWMSAGGAQVGGLSVNGPPEGPMELPPGVTPEVITGTIKNYQEKIRQHAEAQSFVDAVWGLARINQIGATLPAPERVELARAVEIAAYSLFGKEPEGFGPMLPKIFMGTHFDGLIGQLVDKIVGAEAPWAARELVKEGINQIPFSEFLTNPVKAIILFSVSGGTFGAAAGGAAVKIFVLLMQKVVEPLAQKAGVYTVQKALDIYRQEVEQRAQQQINEIEEISGPLSAKQKDGIFLKEIEKGIAGALALALEGEVLTPQQAGILDISGVGPFYAYEGGYILGGVPGKTNYGAIVGGPPTTDFGPLGLGQYRTDGTSIIPDLPASTSPDPNPQTGSTDY